MFVVLRTLGQTESACANHSTYGGGVSVFLRKAEVIQLSASTWQKEHERSLCV